MGIFSQYKTDGLEQVQDRIGGFTPLDSDIYIATIKAMYAQPAKSGALGVTLLATLDNGKEYQETFYVSDKEGKNYFLNKQDSTKKVPLPGFVVVNDICLIASDMPLSDQETEEKVLNIYDPEAKKELPKNVPVITALIGKKVALAIANELHNKTTKVGDSYQETAESVNRNAVVKVFHPEYKITVYEATEEKDPTFWDKWLERYKGQVIDRRKIKDGEQGKEGRPPKAAPQATTKPTKSLFGKRD